MAARRNVSVASVIRDAIDHGLAEPDARRRAAARDILQAPAMEVPTDVDDLLAELEELRGRRA